MEDLDARITALKLKREQKEAARDLKVARQKRRRQDWLRVGVLLLILEAPGPRTHPKASGFRV